jgi:transposase
MNSKELFALGLGLPSPWEIATISLEENESSSIRTLHIFIDFVVGSKFKDVLGIDRNVHDTVERTWQHLNFFQHKCYLHARVPRIIDGEEKVKTVSVPWAREGSGFTLLFEAFSMLLIESEMPVRKAAKLLLINAQRLWTIFHYWIRRAHKNDVVGEIKVAGFDETSSRKGHNYVTTMVDLDEKRVLFAVEGKGSDCIAKAAAYLESKGVSPTGVEQICIDMSPAFISGCEKSFPQASVTFDKFHVVKEVNKAMDELRKEESKYIADLRGHRFTFLKKKISSVKETIREELVSLYPNLGEGYRLKELFNEFWNIREREDADCFLTFWCDQVKDSNIKPFIKVVKTIENHRDGILNYIESRITSGIIEGLNAKIQLAKRRARGYSNIDNFINMIYLTCGKLKFDYPL